MGISNNRRFWRRRALIGVGMLLAFGGIIMGLIWWTTRMPGKSSQGLSPASEEVQNITRDLERDLQHLSGRIGERNVSRRPEALEQAANWIELQLTEAGWKIDQQEYEVEGVKVRNIIAETRGKPESEEIVITGAHYDSVVRCPGANDNGSGVVALLSLARLMKPGTLDMDGRRTLRLVFFVNEEPPWFQHDEMGSLVYARRCHQQKEKITAMLSLETMGYYSDLENSQQYPVGVLKRMFPTTGNFIAFVGNTSSASLVRKCVDVFRRDAGFPSEGAAIPNFVPGVGWSDHWSFQIHGYPAIMVTDTAPFRYPYYHTEEDTPDKVDYEKLARVTIGLKRVLQDLTKIH